MGSSGWIIGLIIGLGIVLVIFVPIILVFSMFVFSKKKRNRKNETYLGRTEGEVIRVVKKGLEHPWVIHVRYQVNGKTYEIKESASLKSETIKVAGIPVGQRKRFVLGDVREGEMLEIRYDEKNPEKAIIYGNDGLFNV